MSQKIINNTNGWGISSISIEPKEIENSFEEEFGDWYQNVLNTSEKLIREWEKGLGKESCCKIGCKHCCNHAIEVYNFEIIPIIKYIKENNIDFAFDRGITVVNYLDEKLPILTSQYSYLDDNELAKYKVEYRNLEIPCIFLKDNKCSIYSVRPTSCLNYHCYSSAEKCSKLDAMPKGCISLGQIEDWIVKQVDVYFNLNKEKIPRYFGPFEINILPIGFINNIIYLD